MHDLLKCIDKFSKYCVQVPRGDRILDWAIQVIKAHAERKAILEVEFLGEEGTGLGPTLEFFALVAAELQRKVGSCFLLILPLFGFYQTVIIITQQLMN